MNKNAFYLFAALIGSGLAFAGLSDGQAAARQTQKPFVNVAASKLPSFISGASAAFAKPSAASGERASLVITLTIKPGYHINYANDKEGVATAVEVGPATADLKVTPIVYPSVGKASKPSGASGPRGYTGTVRFTSVLRIAKNAKPGTRQIPVAITVQGCNATSCFPPETINLVAPLTVAAP